MKPETNTGFDASITVARDREAVVKTAEKLPSKFHFPPVKEPQYGSDGMSNPLSGLFMVRMVSVSYPGDIKTIKPDSAS